MTNLYFLHSKGVIISTYYTLRKPLFMESLKVSSRVFPGECPRAIKKWEKTVQINNLILILGEGITTLDGSKVL